MLTAAVSPFLAGYPGDFSASLDVIMTSGKRLEGNPVLITASVASFLTASDSDVSS